MNCTAQTTLEQQKIRNQSGTLLTEKFTAAYRKGGCIVFEENERLAPITKN